MQLLLPHMTTKDEAIGGYVIPKGTQVSGRKRLYGKIQSVCAFDTLV